MAKATEETNDHAKVLQPDSASQKFLNLCGNFWRKMQFGL